MPEIAAASAAMLRSERIDVLVVDDDAAVRTSFATILRTAGYEVAEAENGAAALSTLSSTDVGAIVLDVQMPEMNGLQLLDALMAPPPVVLLTALDHDADIIARASKIFAYAQKPIPPDDLRKVVAQALGKDG